MDFSEHDRDRQRFQGFAHPQQRRYAVGQQPAAQADIQPFRHDAGDGAGNAEGFPRDADRLDAGLPDPVEAVLVRARHVDEKHKLIGGVPRQQGQALCDRRTVIERYAGGGGIGQVHIQRVVDRHGFRQQGAHGGGVVRCRLRQGDAVARALGRQQPVQPAGKRGEADPVAGRQAADGQQLQAFDKRFRAGHLDDAVAVAERIPQVAFHHHRGGMAERDGRAGRAVAALDGDDRHAFSQGGPAGLTERLAVVQPFQIQADGAHPVIAQGRFDTIRCVDDGLVADAESIAERKALFDAGHAQQKRPALRDDGAAGRAFRLRFDMALAAPDGGAVELVHHAEAVRPDHRHRPGGLGQTRLQGPARIVQFGEAGDHAHGGGRAAGAQLFNGGDGAFRRQRQQGGVGRFRQGVDGGGAFYTRDFVAGRIDDPDLTLVAGAAAHRYRPFDLTAADEGNVARLHQPDQIVAALAAEVRRIGLSDIHGDRVTLTVNLPDHPNANSCRYAMLSIGQHRKKRGGFSGVRLSVPAVRAVPQPAGFPVSPAATPGSVVLPPAGSGRDHRPGCRWGQAPWAAPAAARPAPAVRPAGRTAVSPTPGSFRFWLWAGSYRA